MGGNTFIIICLAFTLTIAKGESLNGCTSPGVCSNYTTGAKIVKNPLDCGSFCVCTCDGPILMKCPVGMEFNNRTQQCDYRLFANCSIPLPPPKPNGCVAWKEFCKSAKLGTLKPNPNDCGSYCICDILGPARMECPLGLHFSVATNRCELPSDAGCGSGPPPTSGPNTTNQPPTSAPSGDCSAMVATCQSSPVGTLLRNPNDCGSYCQCDGVTAVWMPCPAGLHFSVTTNRCELPSEAGCGSGPAPTSGPNTTNQPPTSAPSGDCSAMIAACQSSPVGTLLRNPNDCGSYCQCDGVTAVWMPCPAGLHFSVTTNRCELPSEAGCGSGPAPTSGPNTTNQPPTSAPSGDCSAMVAACQSSPVGTLLRNPNDCGSYCQCDGVTAVWMPCPAGLHFSTSTNRCELPSDAGCGSGPAPTSGPNTTNQPPTPPPSGDCSAMVATCQSSPVGTLLRNPNDCGSYCQCDGVTAVWMPCPAGLHFSVATNRCELPSDAGCGSGPAPTSGPNTTKQPPSPPPSGDCSAMIATCQSSPVGTLLRNPNDCGSYCECDGVTAVWMPCPAGLHFSTSTNRCEWPSIAGCGSGPAPTSRPNTTKQPPSPGCELVEHLCPKVNEVNATLLQNPINCESYCVCDWGRAIWMPCPDGLQFNPELHVCDWPDRAGCRLVFN